MSSDPSSDLHLQLATAQDFDRTAESDIRLKKMKNSVHTLGYAHIPGWGLDTTCHSFQVFIYLFYSILFYFCPACSIYLFGCLCFYKRLF